MGVRCQRAVTRKGRQREGDAEIGRSSRAVRPDAGGRQRQLRARQLGYGRPTKQDHRDSGNRSLVWTLFEQYTSVTLAASPPALSVAYARRHTCSIANGVGRGMRLACTTSGPRPWLDSRNRWTRLLCRAIVMRHGHARRPGTSSTSAIHHGKGDARIRVAYSEQHWSNPSLCDPEGRPMNGYWNWLPAHRIDFDPYHICDLSDAGCHMTCLHLLDGRLHV